MRNFLLGGMLILGALAAPCPTSAKCPIHDSTGVYVRDTWPDGKHVKVFKCPWNHEFSIVC
jgi:ribosomal protein RSM22 (predicted rRNA methylase)